MISDSQSDADDDDDTEDEDDRTLGGWLAGWVAVCHSRYCIKTTKRI